MAVRKLNPITPGQRHKIIGAFDTITASAPEKSLVGGFGKSGGRNNTGKMTMLDTAGRVDKFKNRYKAHMEKNSK